MRVLVTGGAGYIGSVTAAVLLEAGHDVVVLDDLRTGHSGTIPSGATFAKGSIADRYAVRAALEGGVDACAHFASYIDVAESVRAPEQYFQNNTAGSLSLLRVLVEEGVRRFVLSSTAAVYGQPIRLPISEYDPTEPTNPYGESKLMVERSLAWIMRAHGLRYASLRYFNAAGAHGSIVERHHPETHLIPRILAAADGSSPSVTVNGDDYPTADGTCIRDYVHVTDLAVAHLRAIEALEDEKQIICNLGNGDGFSVAEVIEVARRVTGRAIAVKVGPRRLGDPAALVASSTRARHVLGWVPCHTLEQIVESAWHADHREKHVEASYPRALHVAG